MSGLWAGFALSSVGLKVLVLESRDRVGGRTHTIKSKVTGEAIDRGACASHRLLACCSI